MPARPSKAHTRIKTRVVLLLLLIGGFLLVSLFFPLHHVLIGAFTYQDPKTKEFTFGLFYFSRIFRGSLTPALILWLVASALLVTSAHLSDRSRPLARAVFRGLLWGTGPPLVVLFGAQPNLLSLLTGLAAGIGGALASPLGAGRGVGRADVARGMNWAVAAGTVCLLATGLDPTTLEQGWLANSLLLGLAVTALTVVIALPLAVFTVRYSFPGKSLLSGLLLVPMILPPFVGAIGLQRILARYGSLNLLLMDWGLVDPSDPIDFLGGGRFWAVVLLEVLHLYPIMYLNLTAALANVDPSMEQAAQNLGDSGWRLFRKITMPLALPGLFAGCSIVFIWAFTDLGTPLVLGYQDVAAKRIFDLVREGRPDQQAYALVVAVLGLSFLLFLLTKQALAGRSASMLLKGSVVARERRAPVRLRPFIYGAFLGVTLLALLPHLGVVLTSLADRWFMTPVPESYTGAHFEMAVNHPLTGGSIARSLGYALASTVLDIFLGVSIALFAARGGSRWGGLLDGISMLPLAIPGIVLAFGFVGAYSWLSGWLTDTGMGWAGFLVHPRDFPVLLLIMSYSIRRLPFMVRAVYAGLEQVSPAYEEASLNLGASPGVTLRRITLPLISSSIAAGVILTFSFALLEVSDSLILAVKSQFYPFTKAIFVTFGWLTSGENVASAMGVIAMGILSVSLLLAAGFMGRRLGEMFRVG